MTGKTRVASRQQMALSELAEQLGVSVPDLAARLDADGVRLTVPGHVVAELVAEAARQREAAAFLARQRAEDAERHRASRERARAIREAEDSVKWWEGQLRDAKWRVENWPTHSLNPITGETEPVESVRREFERTRVELAAARERLNALTSERISV